MFKRSKSNSLSSTHTLSFDLEDIAEILWSIKEFIDFSLLKESKFFVDRLHPLTLKNGILKIIYEFFRPWPTQRNNTKAKKKREKCWSQFYTLDNKIQHLPSSVLKEFLPFIMRNVFLLFARVKMCHFISYTIKIWPKRQQQQHCCCVEEKKGKKFHHNNYERRKKATTKVSSWQTVKCLLKKFLHHRSSSLVCYNGNCV